MHETSQGIPVYELGEFYSPEDLKVPGRQDLVGVIRQDDVREYVKRRVASAEALPSGLTLGEYILIVGSLKVFLPVDQELVKSLETTVDRSGRTNSLAGQMLLHALLLN